MKKLLTTFFVGLLAVVSAFGQTTYTGTFTAGQRQGTDTGVTGTVYASLNGNVLTLWNIPGTGSGGYANPWGTESSNNLKFEIAGLKATAAISSISSQPAGRVDDFNYGYTGSESKWTNIEGTFDETYTTLSIPAIIIRNSMPFGSVGTSCYGVKIIFDSPLNASGANDPKLTIENIDYDNINSFTVQVKADNIEDTENVKLFYSLTNEEGKFTQAASSDDLTYNITLSDLTPGQNYTLYVYASYQQEGEDEVKSEVSDKPFVTPKAYGSGEMSWASKPVAEEKEKCDVTAILINNRLTITNFANLNPIVFTVGEDGKCTGDKDPTGKKNEYGTTYYYYGLDGSGNVQGTLVNVSETSSKLTIEGWSQGYATPSINYYNTVINFDFAIPGLPLPATLTIGDVTVSDVTYNSATITVNDVEYEGFEADEVTVSVSVNAKGTQPSSYLTAKLNGNTATLTVSDLAPATEYTVTAYAKGISGETTVETEKATYDFTTGSAPTLSIEKLEVVNVTALSAEVTYELAATNVPATATYAITAKDVFQKEVGKATGATGTITLTLESGLDYDITFTATVSDGETVLATAQKTVESIITPTLTVGQPNITFAQVDNTITATIAGKVTASTTVSDFSIYQIMYDIAPRIGNSYVLSSKLSADGSYSFNIAGMTPGIEYTLNMTPYTITPVKACGTELQTKFTPEVSTTGPVEANGTMTYDGGSYQVSAVYNAEKSTLTLKGVGGKTNPLVFNVSANGSLVSETNQLYGWDTDYDPEEESWGREAEIYYSDNPATIPYRVTGTAKNSGANCILTLGNIGAYTTLDNAWWSNWNNTVITLDNLNLNIETIPSISITDVDMEKNESGYEFTVTLTSDNITGDINVSYTVDPEIEGTLPAVTKNTDGTYTFTLPTSSLTAGTKYTVTVSASAGDVSAADVTRTFTASASGTGDSDFTTVTLTGNYTKITSTNGYFTFDNNESNPFGTKFSLTYYSPGSTGEYQKLGLYNAGVYTQEGDKYVFVVAGSIDEAGVVKPIAPSSKVNTDRNQLVFNYDTGLFENGLCEKSGNSYQAMPNAVICVVECSMTPDRDNYNAPVYTVEDVKSVYRFLGGRYGKSLTEKTDLPKFSGYYSDINFVSGTSYSWTLKLQEVEDFHYGDVETLVEAIEAADADARYFTLQGVEIRNPEAGTLCIKVSGNKATKVIIR